MELQQFVPQEVCLKCDGCCRFKDEESLWRPKIAGEEIKLAVKNGLAEEVFSKKTVGDDGHLRTVSCAGNHFCTFFHPGDNTCGIYRNRPFECRLYPFILTKRNQRVVICVHLLCPFIQEKRHDPAFKVYVDYLKFFFNESDVIDFLRRNPSLAGDYAGYEEELEYLFALSI